MRLPDDWSHKGVRRFRESDWIGALIGCDHCHRVLKVIAAKGPIDAPNPTTGYWDRVWILTLEDGEQCRMWEDGQGIKET